MVQKIKQAWQKGEVDQIIKWSLVLSITVGLVGWMATSIVASGKNVVAIEGKINTHELRIEQLETNCHALTETIQGIEHQTVENSVILRALADKAGIRYR